MNEDDSQNGLLLAYTTTIQMIICTLSSANVYIIAVADVVLETLINVQ